MDDAYEPGGVAHMLWALREVALEDGADPGLFVTRVLRGAGVRGVVDLEIGRVVLF